MTSEAELWKSISKITPNPSNNNAEEDCDDAIWACNLIQKQDRENRDNNMLLNSENAKRTELNLKKQLDHTLDSMMNSAMSDLDAWSNLIPSDLMLYHINEHVSSIDKHLTNIEALLRKRK